jgi:hypothetical protein
MKNQNQWLFEPSLILETPFYADLEYYSSFEWELQESPSETCSNVKLDCQFMSDKEKEKVKPGPDSTPQGRYEIRKDSDADFAIQLIDYDVNDWRPKKYQHQIALELVIDFLLQRKEEIKKSNGIEITVSGQASKTGGKEQNDILSCKRAICVIESLKVRLEGRDRSLLNKVKFSVSGKGFRESNCKDVIIEGKPKRNECELPEYRSVLVSAHRPGKTPIPISPLKGWNKYKIRCCSFKTESLGEVAIGKLVDLVDNIEQLPEPLKSVLKDSTKDFLVKSAKDLLKRIRDSLDSTTTPLAKYLLVEVIRDTGVFQIVERDKSKPSDVSLCYSGFGVRVKLPREIPVPEFLKDKIKDGLKKMLKRMFRGLKDLRNLDELLDKWLTLKVPTIETTSPGSFTDFDVDPNVEMKDFIGICTVSKGLVPGKVFVGFLSKTFHNPDPMKNSKISCPSCSVNTVPVEVGSKFSFEAFAPTRGELIQGSCKCVEEIPPEILRATSRSRLLSQNARVPGRQIRKTPSPRNHRKYYESEKQWLFEV